MSIGEVPVLLFDGRLIRANGVVDLATRVQSVTKIVMSFSIAAAPLLDGGPICCDGFVDFTEVVEGDSKVVPGRRKPIPQSRRRPAKTGDRLLEFAALIQRKAQIMMRDRIVGPVLDRRAV